MTKANFGIFLSIVVLILFTGITVNRFKSAEKPQTSAMPHPALTVTSIQPKFREIPITLRRYGSIVAWEEAEIGAKVNGLRLIEVKAQVGDQVKKGQLLARFDDRLVLADLAQSRATVAEAQALLAEARVKSQHAQKVADSGALSELQVIEYVTGEKTAAAKLQSAKAQLEKAMLQEKYTKVLAIDNGVVSYRNAVLGSVVTQGQVMFRLIRQSRLEWQAVVSSEDLSRLAVGVEVTLTVPGFLEINGKVRALAPTVDVKNRNALIYVDLPGPLPQGLSPGMFAEGEFRLGKHSGITLPQESLCPRDGFEYAFKLDRKTGKNARVIQAKLTTGERGGDWVEILDGAASDDLFVATGACFLNDGDTVAVVQP